MRRVKIFSGTSHPTLTESICDRLGTTVAACELTKFSNGETSVSIGTSIRDQDVVIVQSGSRKINDSIMELLIMISACKGGSARSITAVLPYFPYSRQSKKKSHRGAITARMLANLLTIAGVSHVVTVDLHAPPMQGFFGKPVDNLHAEPLIASWIRKNVPDWRDAVVVSKNPGGSKRVTSFADTLKLSFGIITTDRRRSPVLSSTILEGSALFDPLREDRDVSAAEQVEETEDDVSPQHRVSNARKENDNREDESRRSNDLSPHLRAQRQTTTLHGSSPLQQSTRADSTSRPPLNRLQRSQTAPSPSPMRYADGAGEEYTDERAREVITGRLIQGHIVDDDFPSPMLSTMSGSIANLPGESLGPSNYDERDPMTSSFMSTVSSMHQEHALGGTYDAAAMSDEDDEMLKDPEVEHTVTLVGDVNERTAFIIDDILDGCSSWIAAAETVVKRGGAKKVYCIATHGLFLDHSLEELEACDCIDYIVVCNTFPIPPEKVRRSEKLVVLEMAGLLAEAIRRNHYGESMGQLYQYYQD